MTTTEHDLLAALTDWAPEQRWYAGKGRAVASMTIDTLHELGEHDGATVYDAILSVDHGGTANSPDGAEAADGSDLPDGPDVIRYQLPLTVRPQRLDELEHAMIGEVPEGVLYDGLLDGAGAARWIELLAEEETRPEISFHRRSEIDVEVAGRVVGVEQSNTSVVYGDSSILKVFRRLAPGMNPDLEITRALAEAGSPHVAAPYGWVEADVAGERTTLAFLQRFLRNGADGWKLATASVRDLFAEGDLNADEVGGDFAGESERLGRATAEVHAVLREVLPSAVVGRDDSEATAAIMRGRLERAVAEVPALEEYAPGLLGIIDALANEPGDVAVQRVHGDYHLGQVLRTDTGWSLLDFEGEPARPLSERTTLMSPLRDVAGMLRSFDYAAQSLLAERSGEHGLAYHADQWATRNRSAFLDGYSAAGGEDPRSSAVRLKAFEVDKAIYEVVYEAHHRPTWLRIPLGSLARLIAT